MPMKKRENARDRRKWRRRFLQRRYFDRQVKARRFFEAYGGEPDKFADMYFGRFIVEPPHSQRYDRAYRSTNETGKVAIIDFDLSVIEHHAVGIYAVDVVRKED